MLPARYDDDDDPTISDCTDDCGDGDTNCNTISITINITIIITCYHVDFDIPVDQRFKMKEIEPKDKYFDLAREPKKQGNMSFNADTSCSWSAGKSC